MKTSLPAKKLRMFGMRETAILRTLMRHPTVCRDILVRECGFGSPQEDPIRSYVAFHNALLRLNAELRWLGFEVSGGIDTNERYRLRRLAQ